MGLRERQKLNRRETMLDAARSLFDETGYARTTMESIAENAEVGVATVYKYFGTKEGILAEQARGDLEKIRARGTLVTQSPPVDPVRTIANLLEIYDEVRELVSAEVIVSFTSGAKQGGPLRDTAQWANGWKKAQIGQVIDNGKATGKLAAGLPTKDSVAIIMALFNHYYDSSVSDDRGASRRAFRKLLGLVALVFDDWRAVAADEK